MQHAPSSTTSTNRNLPHHTANASHPHSNGHSHSNPPHSPNPSPSHTNNTNNANNSNNPNQGTPTVNALAKQTWDALQQMHGQHTRPQDRSQADHFLCKILPNQTSCWQVFATFLNTKDAPHQVHFFAANMLRSKIQRNLHQVPQQQHQSLHDMLLNALIAFNKKGKEYENVRTQLSIALALIAIQRTDWTNEVQAVVDQLAKEETLDILLNILTRLPEELYHFKIPLSSKYKKVASDNLRNHAPLVLRLLRDLFAMVSTKKMHSATTVKIFKCFAAWLCFMDNHFTEYMRNYKVLTKYCFESLANDELFDEAVTCISRILRLSDGETSGYFDDYGQDEQKVNDKEQQIEVLLRENFEILVPNIIALKPMYDRAVKEEDERRCLGLTRLFVDAAEQYCDWIIQSGDDEQVGQLLQIILQCSGHRDPAVSVYCCYFWTELFRPFLRIAEEFKRNQPRGTALWDNFERPWPQWARRYVVYPATASGQIGLIPTILPTMVSAAKLPEDFDEMDPDEQDEAMEVRWQIADNIGDICNILGLHAALQVLSNLLDSFCVSNPAAPINSASDGAMDRVYRCEAILFCLQSGPRCDPLERGPNNSGHPLLRIFGQLRRLPQHFLIRRSAIHFIAAHLSFVTVQDEVFEFLYNFTMTALDEPKCQKEAVRALRAFCTQFDAATLPRQFTASLFAIYDEKSHHLAVRDQVVLIEAMATLISKCRHLDDARQGVGRLLQKPKERLAALLRRASEDGFADSGSLSMKAKELSLDGLTLYDTVNIISQIFKFFNPRSSEGNGPEKAEENISVKLLEEMWPNVRFLLTTFTECDGVMEKTTRIIKHVIRNGGAKQFSASALCIEALRLLTDLYCSKSQRSSFLYIVWIYVDEYMAMPQAAKALMETLSKLAQCTFAGPLRDEESFLEHVDIVEDFYELIVQYIRKAHHYLVQNTAFVRSLFERATCGLLLDHQKSQEAVIAFMTESVLMAEHGEVHRELVDGLLFGPQGFGRRIVTKILEGLCCAVRRERASALAELLNELVKYDGRRIEDMTKQIVTERIQTESRDPTKFEFVEEYFDRRNDSRFRHKYAMEWFDANSRWKQQMTF